MAVKVRKMWLEDVDGTKIAPRTTRDQILNPDGSPFEETDPTVPQHVKGITAEDVTEWRGLSERIDNVDARTVNGHSVNSDVPANAKFTDTVTPVVDNLTSDSTTSALSAKQGKILAEEDAVLEQKIADIDIQTAHETDLSLDTFEGGIGVEKIEGGTYKWNQLVSSYTIGETNGVTVSKNADGTINIKGTCSTTPLYNQLILSTSIKFRRDGSIYAIKINKTAPYDIGINGYAPKLKSGNTIAYWSDSADSSWSGSIFILCKSGFVFDISNIAIEVIDVTSIFGKGHEPETVSDFESWLASVGRTGNQAYNPGSVVSAGYGYIDLGTLNWSVLIAGRYIANLATGQKSSDAPFCDKYNCVSYDNRSFAEGNLFINSSEGTILICDSSVSSAAAFKESLAGVMLAYEVANDTKADEYALVVKENGKNIFNTYWTIGKHLSDRGGVYDETGAATCDYIAVKKGVTYSFWCESHTKMTVEEYADNNQGAFIRYIQWKTNLGSFTIGENCKYIRIAVSGASSNIEVSKPMLSIGETATPYAPYISKTLPLPIGTTPLAKIGDIADEIVKEDGVWKRITRFGVVDLGTLTWSNSANRSGVEPANAYVTSSLNSVIKKIADDNAKSNALSAKYVATPRNIQYIGGYDKLSVNSTGNVYVNSSTTPSGMLIYELAEPIVEVIPNQELLYSLESYAEQTHITTADGLAKLSVNYGASDVAATALLAENNAELALMGNKNNAEEISRVDSDFSIQTTIGNALDLATDEGGVSVNKIVGETHKSKNLWSNYDVTSVSEYAHFTNKTLKEICPAIVAGKTYTLTVYGNGTKQIYLANGVTIPSGTSFTPSSDDINANVYVYGAASGTVTIGPWQIEEGTSATPYESYGMWSAGCGYVKLADLTWTYDSTTLRFVSSEISNSVIYDDTVIPNAYINRYVAESGNTSYNSRNNMTFCIGKNKKLYIRDTYYTTVDTFNNMLQNEKVMLAYEVAEGAKADEYTLVTESSNRNILNIVANTSTMNGITYKVDHRTGVVTVSGTKSGLSYIHLGTVKLKKGVTYCISGHNSNANVFCGLWTSSWISRSDRANHIYTATEDIVAEYYIQLNSDGACSDVVYPMLEIADKENDFVCHEGKTLVFPIGKTPLSSVGDIADEIYKEDGVWKRITRFGVVDLGTLTWERESSTGYFICKNFKNTYFVKYPMKNQINPIYDNVTAWSDFTKSTDKTIYLDSNNNLYVKNTSYSDISTFKTAMSGVTLVYELVSYTVEVLPNQSDYYSLLSYAERTYITTIDGLAKLEVSYGKLNTAAIAIKAKNDACIALMDTADLKRDNAIHSATDKSLDLVTGKGGMRWQDDAIEGGCRRSKNQWDEQWDNGSIVANIGKSYTPSTGQYIRSKNRISVKESTNYCIIKGNNVTWVYAYDSNDILLGWGDAAYYSLGASDSTFKTPAKTKYIRFLVEYSTYGTVYKNDIAVIEGTSGSYEPYGIRSAGDGYGMIDLGTLSWSKDSSGKFYYNLSSGVLKGMLLCEKYTYSDAARVEDMADKTIWNRSYAFAPKNIVIRDDSITTVDALKASLAGVMLTYALAENANPSQYALVVDERNDVFNGNIVNGWYSYTTGAFTNTTRGVSTDIYSCIANSKVSVKIVDFPFDMNVYVIFYNNGNYVSGYAKDKCTEADFTVPDVANGFRFSFITTSTTGSITKDTAGYALISNQSKTYPIPLPHPIRGIGDVREMVRKVGKEWMMDKKFGVVDLGSLVWNYNGNNLFYSGGISDAKVNAHGICALGEIGSYTKDWGILINDTTYHVVYINAPGFTDGNLLKSYLSGVMLIYELAAPTTEPLPDQSAMYELESYAQQTHITTADGLATLNVEYGTSDEIGLLLENNNKVNMLLAMLNS